MSHEPASLTDHVVFFSKGERRCEPYELGFL